MFKRSACLLLLTLTLVSCGKSGSSGSSGPSSMANLDTEDVTGPNVPEAALTLKTTGVNLIDMTRAQEKKMNEALKVLKLVVATEAFREAVLNHKYSGKKQFANNNGLTNEQIYIKILEAAEKLKPVKNNTVDMGVEMYTASNNVVGYTYPNSTQIWVNTKYFNQYTPAGVAHNLMHEWLHKLGFGHDSSATTRRPYSVPYAIGYIVKDIGANFL